MKIYWRVGGICTLLLIGIISCKKNEVKVESTTTQKVFVMPEIPDLIVDDAARINYLIENYWSQMDFNDTSYVHYPKVTDQAVVDYIDMLRTSDDTLLVNKSVANFLAGVSTDSSGVLFNYLIDVFTRYTNNSNSPVRSERLYRLLARSVIASDYLRLDMALKERIRFDLEMINKNRVGQKANDFQFILASGKVGSLYETHAQYTILFFYDPDCNVCSNYVDIFNKHTLLNSYIEQKKIKVLAVCVEDKFEQWKNDIEKLPSTWIKAYDIEQQITRKRIYSLDVMPMMYLLDKDKKVILKDPELSELLGWIDNQEKN